MPIEIKELHIKIAVNAPQNGQGANSQNPPAAIGSNNKASLDKDEIVAECIDQVFKILKNKMER